MAFSILTRETFAADALDCFANQVHEVGITSKGNVHLRRSGQARWIFEVSGFACWRFRAQGALNFRLQGLQLGRSTGHCVAALARRWPSQAHAAGPATGRASTSC